VFRVIIREFINYIAMFECRVLIQGSSSLVSTAALAYSLGLRHAFDADHISVCPPPSSLMSIVNISGYRSHDKKTVSNGPKARNRGHILLTRSFYVRKFPMHIIQSNISRIVIITSIVVAATAAAVSSRFDKFSTIGGIIGSGVSAAFLILLGVMNAYILYKLIKQLQKVFNLPEGQEDEAWKIEGGGILFSVLKKMFKLIDRYALYIFIKRRPC
jgi:high-affinity nickel-transport protein